MGLLKVDGRARQQCPRTRLCQARGSAGGPDSPEAELLALALYSPSSSPTKKDPRRDSQNVEPVADGAAHRHNHAKTDGEHCRAYQGARNPRGLHHCSRLFRIGSRLAADMQRKLAPSSSVVGAKGGRLRVTALIVARRLCADQIETRALIIGPLAKLR